MRKITIYCFLLFGFGLSASPSSARIAAAVPLTPPPCLGVQILFNTDTAVCLEAGLAPVPLSATVLNGNANGSLSWSGPGVSGNIFDANSLGPGQYWVYAEYNQPDPCNVLDSLLIRVHPPPSNQFTLSQSSSCTNQAIQLTYNGHYTSGLLFNWDFGGASNVNQIDTNRFRLQWDSAGTYRIQLFVSNPACNTQPDTAIQTVFITAPLAPLHIRCDSVTQNSIIFNWNNIPEAAGYRIQRDNQTFLLSQDTSLSIDNLFPSDSVQFIVQALSSGICGNGQADTLTCISQGCPDLFIDFAPIDTLICLDALTQPLPLLALVSGGSGINARQMWTGPGVDTENNLFNPRLVGEGAYWLRLSYMEKGPCGIADSILIRVFSIPTGPFTLSANQVCLGDTATITYVGSAGPTASLDWSFGAVDTLPHQNSRGPIQLLFPAPGLYPIALSVTENGCNNITSTDTDSIRVTAPLPELGLRCGLASRNSLQFDWRAANANSTYLLNGGMGEVQATTDTFLQFLNLLPGDSLQLVVETIGDFPCGNGPADTLVCRTLPCPSFSFDFSAIDTFLCDFIDALPRALTASILGGEDPNGTLLWEGPGILPGTNIFDPRLVGPGSYTLVASYSELGPCTHTDSLRIQVASVPQSAVRLQDTLLCAGSLTNLFFEGQASETATFDWEFPGATLLAGSGRGPYQIRYDSAGLFPIRLAITDNNCSSQADEQVGSIRVFPQPAALELSCGTPAYNSIQVDWLPSAGAASYRVRLLESDATNTQISNGFTLTGLRPDTAITFVVRPLSSNICGEGPSDTIRCQTLACPSVLFDFSSLPAQICQTDDLSPILLPNSVISTDQSSQITWSGTSVRLIGGRYYFQPLFAGVGSFELLATYEGVAGCRADSNFTLQLLAAPRVDAGENQVLDCRNASVTLSGMAFSPSGISQYQWAELDAANNTPAGNTPTIEVNRAGTYSLRVTDYNQCSSTDSVAVLLRREAPRLSLESFPLRCAGDQDGLIAILAIEGGQPPYQLQLNGQATQARSFPDLGPGAYTFQIDDAAGCAATQIVQLNAPPPLRVELSTDAANPSAVPFGTRVNLVANIFGGSTIDTILWQPPNRGTANWNRFQLLVESQGSIAVEVIDEQGCRASDQILLSPALTLPVFIPSAFSPNGDNTNDIFLIYADDRQVERIETLAIFDRWGERVFQQNNFPPNDPQFGWNGHMNGKNLQPAVFAFYAKLRLYNGEVHTFTGNLTLLR